MRVSFFGTGNGNIGKAIFHTGYGIKGGTVITCLVYGLLSVEKRRNTILRVGNLELELDTEKKD